MIFPRYIVCSEIVCALNFMNVICRVVIVVVIPTPMIIIIPRSEIRS